MIFLASAPTSNFTAQTLNGAAGCNNSIVPCTSFSGTSPEPNNLGIMMLIPLGVSFVDFSAEAIDRNVLLRWSTVSEINSDYFTIERSLDGENFGSIGEVQAAGSSQHLLDYEFVDANVFMPNTQYYYRVKEVDFDGKFMYTELRLVQMNQQQSNHIVVFPNPFTEVMNVFIPQKSINDHTQIFLMDELNRVIETYSVQHEMNSLMLGGLSKGIYFISVVDGGRLVETVRVVK